MDTSQHDAAAWKAALARFRKPDARRASWQLVNTLGSYAIAWYLYVWSLGVSWWLVPPLVLLASGMLIRTFIIFHDCGHGSFFASRSVNDFWGFVTGLLLFTPYFEWRGEHAIHHGTAGDLDRRGTGDIWTLTVQEYLDASRWRKFSYRLSRNPFVLFVLAPLAMFVVLQRFPRGDTNKRARHSVWWMNLAIALMMALMMALVGVVPYLVFQFASLLVATSVGVWLFYVQHQFENAYWERGEDWDYLAAAMKGSSYFKLPKVLQWFSGNIGFHHIHHLNSSIPNYNLERCHGADPMFSRVAPVTLWGALKALQLKLWDESSRKLVGFRHLRELRRGRH